MSIKEVQIKIKKHPKNYKYYNNRFDEEDGFYIVPIDKVSVGSKALVTKVCDNCKKEKIIPYKNVIQNRKEGKDYCWCCGNNTSAALLNKSNSHKGYKWTTESKLKASNSHKGMKHSEETKEKIKESVIKTTNSKEWKNWIIDYNYKTKSLDAYIKKYGETRGEELFKIERRSKSIFCLEYWIIKNNGNVDKAVKSLSDFQRRDLNYFIKKYGKKEGEEKYSISIGKRIYNNKNKYSKISQSFIKEMIEYLNLSENSLYYGDDEWIIYLYKEERKIFENKRIFSVDFYDRANSIVIEYDGDYWHSKESQQLEDDARDKILYNRGIKTFRVKEKKYLSNKELILKEIKEFYENCKNTK